MTLNIYKVTVTLSAKNEKALRDKLVELLGSTTAMLAVIEKVGRER